MVAQAGIAIEPQEGGDSRNKEELSGGSEV